MEALRDKRRGAGGVTEYLVKWEGYKESENTWEPAENISLELVAKFVPAPGQCGRQSIGPYVLTVSDPVEPAVAAGLVGPWLATVGRKSYKLLARQQEAWAYKQLEHMDTCPAWMFKALHAAFEQKAASLTGMCSVRSAQPSRPDRRVVAALSNTKNNNV